jgi:hypothetical protein
VGVGGPAGSANPFFAGRPPPPEFVLWSVGWIAVVLAAATLSLSRRDL